MIAITNGRLTHRPQGNMANGSQTFGATVRTGTPLDTTSDAT
jgi:hypothetical protein